MLFVCKKKKALVEARNQADALIYQTKKSIMEMGSSLDSSMISSIETTINSLKHVMNGEDTDEIGRLTETLRQASHEMATAVYQQSADTGTQSSSGNSGSDMPDDDEVVDAEYQEVA